MYIIPLKLIEGTMVDLLWVQSIVYPSTRLRLFRLHTYDWEWLCTNRSRASWISNANKNGYRTQSSVNADVIWEWIPVSLH